MGVASHMEVIKFSASDCDSRLDGLGFVKVGVLIDGVD